MPEPSTAIWDIKNSWDHEGVELGRGIQSSNMLPGLCYCRVSQVLDAVQLSQATFTKIKQNLGWAFGYNIIGIPLAAGALLPSAGIALTPTVSGGIPFITCSFHSEKACCSSYASCAHPLSASHVYRDVPTHAQLDSRLPALSPMLCSCRLKVAL